jgi:predicted phosphodiesterase
MRIRVLSDLHLEYASLDHLPDVQSDCVVLAGDIHVGTNGVTWAKETFKHQPVIYVPGNHEYYYGEAEQVLSEMRDAAKGSNVQVLDKGVIEVCGVRFIGATLWTDFNLYSNDPHEEMWAKVEARRGVPDFDGRIQIKDGAEVRAVSPSDTQRWHRESCNWLSDILMVPFSGSTVVISHHAPSAKSIGKMYRNSPCSPAFAYSMESLVAEADLWIHGHTHEPVDYWVGQCRVLSNSRGYGTEVELFKADLVISF